MKAAVACFGELWEVDSASNGLLEVSYFQVNVRCLHVRAIPKCLSLMVEDRSFNVPIEIKSWEEARPIFLGETMDRHLELETAEEQDLFIRQTGFRCIPAAAGQSGSSTQFGCPL